MENKDNREMHKKLLFLSSMLRVMDEDRLKRVYKYAKALSAKERAARK